MSINSGPRLYRTDDGRIVAEGDPTATFLVVGQGGTIPAEYADAVKAYTDQVADEPKPERPAMKRGGPAENK